LTLHGGWLIGRGVRAVERSLTKKSVYVFPGLGRAVLEAAVPSLNVARPWRCFQKRFLPPVNAKSADPIYPINLNSISCAYKPPNPSSPMLFRHPARVGLEQNVLLVGSSAGVAYMHSAILVDTGSLSALFEVVWLVVVMLLTSKTVDQYSISNRHLLEPE
jgi:hypothetical protein